MSKSEKKGETEKDLLALRVDKVRERLGFWDLKKQSTENKHLAEILAGSYKCEIAAGDGRAYQLMAHYINAETEAVETPVDSVAMKSEAAACIAAIVRMLNDPDNVFTAEKPVKALEDAVEEYTKRDALFALPDLARRVYKLTAKYSNGFTEAVVVNRIELRGSRSDIAMTVERLASWDVHDGGSDALDWMVDGEDSDSE